MKIKLTCAASRLSGWAWPNPPVALQSPELRCVVGPILAPEPDQNQPFMLGGCKSGRSQPLKLHFLPDVQMYRTLPVKNKLRVNLMLRTVMLYLTSIHAPCSQKYEFCFFQASKPVILYLNLKFFQIMNFY